VTPNNAVVVLSGLAFLGTGGLLVLLVIAMAWAGFTGRGAVLRPIGLGTAGLAALYLAVWLGAGLLSRETVLPAASEKYFCELDCHLAYSVTGLDSAGRYALVTIRTRFDEKTISPRRPLDAPLWPAPRRLVLIDDKGGAHPPVADQAWALGPRAAGTPITTELKPGESYTTTVAFELPPGVRPSRLLIEDDVPLSRFLIANERSPFHGKTMLAL
jgi:hypothetical protein